MRKLDWSNLTDDDIAWIRQAGVLEFDRRLAAIELAEANASDEDEDESTDEDDDSNEDDEESVEGDEDNYDSWTVAQLRAEIDKREGLEVPAAARKAEMIEALREDDED